jgi:hypothetical protein
LFEKQKLSWRRRQLHQCILSSYRKPKGSNLSKIRLAMAPDHVLVSFVSTHGRRNHVYTPSFKGVVASSRFPMGKSGRCTQVDCSDPQWARQMAQKSVVSPSCSCPFHVHAHARHETTVPLGFVDSEEEKGKMKRRYFMALTERRTEV